MELRISPQNGVKLYSNLICSESNYSKEHKIKHPADIFRTSVEKLDLALNDFLFMRGSHDSDQYKDKAIFNYVLELDSFYERLLLIIKCLTPPGKEDNNDVTKWLKDNNNYQYTQFKDATAKSHNLIRKAANGIKHDTLAVDYLTINNHDNIQIEGFYFSNIVGEDELIGPAPEIHETYKGSSTAFSYDYFIRYTGGFVASCIYHLNNILFKGKKYEPIKIEILYSFFKKTYNSGRLLFPNEFNSPIASFREDRGCIVIKYPSKERRNNEIDNIMSIRPFFRLNQRTNQSNNQWPYYKLLS